MHACIRAHTRIALISWLYQLLFIPHASFIYLNTGPLSGHTEVLVDCPACFQAVCSLNQLCDK